jgi:hypothetical protein
MILELQEKIKRDKFEVSIIEPNIICFKYYAETEIDVEEIKDGFEIHKGLLHHNITKRIIHTEKLVSITRDAREYVQKYAPEVEAEAYVIPSLSQKILFIIYNKMRKNKHLIKTFDNIKDAETWLKRR